MNALQPERRTRPSVLGSTGAASPFWGASAVNSANVSQLAPTGPRLRLLSLTRSTKMVQSQKQHLWSETSVLFFCGKNRAVLFGLLSLI